MAQKNDKKLSALEKLQEQSKQLRSNVSNPVFLINRSPGQIEHVTREMASKVSGQLNQTQIVKANSLLQKKGVDPDEIDRKLVNLQVKSVEQLEHLADTDIEGFLKQHNLQAMLSPIEQIKTQSSVDSLLDNSLSLCQSDFSESMDLIVHSLGADLESIMKQSTEIATASRNFGGIMTDRNASTKKLEDYARVIHVLNECRKIAASYGLITKLSEVSGVARENATRTALQDVWQLLKSMVGEKAVEKSGQMTVGPKENQFSIKDQSDSQTQIEDTFLQGTLNFLHDQYKDIIFRELNFKASSVEIGGDPNLQSNIIGYLSLLYPNGFPADLERGSGKFPIYAFLYFCLRTGNLEVAIEVARKEELSDIVNMLKYRYEGVGNMPANLGVSNLITHTKDPYKHLLLNIFARIDPNKGYNTIPRWSVQDWLWFQFQMLGSKKTPSSSKKDFTLQDLKRQVEKYGASHFNRDGKNPFLYFQILLMTQQFELAIDYGVNNIQTQYVDIIQIAASLYYYGMLNLHQSSFMFRPASSKEPVPAINIANILSRYVKFLSSARLIHAAVDYTVLVRDPIQKKQSLQELALETREFMVLFGEKEGGGQNKLKKGILHEYLPPHELKDIIIHCAKTLESENRTSDAILILDLADGYSEVFRILIDNLGSMLIPNPSYDRDRRVLIDFTDSIFSSYTQSGVMQSIEPKRKATLHTLCHLISFFNLFSTEDYAEALKYIIKLDIIPFHQTDIDTMTNAFKSLDQSVKSNFSHILIDTMQCLLGLYLRAGNVSFESPWSREDLRQFARVIILFISRIDDPGNFKLSADVYPIVSKLEVRLQD
jgi:nuclear pore complex protein Nup93